MLLCSFLCMINNTFSQGGEVPGIKFETTITGDFVRVYSGGVNKQSQFEYLGLEDAVLTFNTEKLGLWKGGLFLLHGQNIHGATPSADYTGDYQVFSNIEAGEHTGLYEFNYRQTLGNLTMMIGQHDLNSQYCVSDYAGIFINSSLGIMPNVSLNVPVGIFPIATPGISIEYEIGEKKIFRTAVYDGYPGNFQTNEYNLEINFAKDEGFLSISEFEINDFDNGGDNYKLGVYYHSAKFDNFNDSVNQVKGNYGIYGIIDKRILEPEGIFENGLNIFLDCGFAPANRNLVSWYIGAGFNMHGFIKKQAHDIFGLGIAHMQISNDFKKLNPSSLSAETAVEFTYQIFIAENYVIQPNLQYIINPGAAKGVGNALVVTLRLSLSF